LLIVTILPQFRASSGVRDSSMGKATLMALHSKPQMIGMHTCGNYC
jgi:hypothetical protein